MNKKLVALLFLPLMLSSCGDNENSSDTFGLPQKSYFEILIEEAEDILENCVKEVIETSPSLMIKGSVCDFYVQETAFIESIDDIETAENAMRLICDHEYSFITETLKPVAYRALELELLPIIYQVKNSETQQEAYNIYYQEVVNDEIGQATDIISTNGAYAYIYNEVTNYLSQADPTPDPERPQPGPDDPQYDPEEEELRRRIGYIEESIYLYIETILSEICYEGFEDSIYYYYRDNLAIRFEDVKTIDEAYVVASEIKERLLGLVYEESAKAALGDMKNFFDEILESFTRQEAIDALTPIKTLYMERVEEALNDHGLFYGDYLVTIDIFKSDALFDIRSKDVKEFWRKDLAEIKAIYSHEKESTQCEQEVKTLYETALQQIDDSNDILELQHDLDEIVANFEKEAKAVAEKYFPSL